MAGDDPPFLPVGTEVSAKYRGAFCEAKVKKIVRSVKCKIYLKETLNSVVVTDDHITKGSLKVGSTVEYKNPDTGQPMEAVINKLTDCSMYTVVFDDGDEKTLRRTQCCLKGEKHFIESETLDNLPLSHPEHFGTPVMSSKTKRRSGRPIFGNEEEESEEESTDESLPRRAAYKGKNQELVGKVFLAEIGEKKKQVLPVLVVLPDAHATELRTKDHLLVKSFKDGKFHTYQRKELKDFSKEAIAKIEDKNAKQALERAVTFSEKQELPSNWEREELLGTDEEDFSDEEEGSDDEPSEEKDRFVAQLYKFMDDRGTSINRMPTLGSKDLNLYRLFNIVQTLGGYNKVTNSNKWKAVAGRMKTGLPSQNMVSHQLKTAYKKYLHAFEDFYRKLGSTMGTISRPGRSRNNSGRGMGVYKSQVKEQEKITATEKEESKSDGESDVDDGDSRSTRSPPKRERVTRRDLDFVVRENRERRDGSKDSRRSDTFKQEEDSKKSVVIKEDAKRTKSGKKQEEKKESDDEEPEAGKQEDKKKTIRRRSARKEEIKKEEEEETEEKKTDPKTKSKVAANKEPEGKPGSKKQDDVKNDKKDDKKVEAKKEKAKVTKKDIKKEVVEEESKEAPVDKVEKKTKKEVTKKSKNEEESTPGKKKSKEEEEEEMEIIEESKPLAANEYPMGTKLQVKYGKGRTEKVYDAKIIEIQRSNGLQYLVHYAGWNMRYDEWIRPEQIVNVLNKPSDIAALKKKAKESPPKSPKAPVSKKGKSPASAPSPSPSPVPGGQRESRPVKRSPAHTPNTPQLKQSKQRPTRSNSIEQRGLDNLPGKPRRTRRSSGVTESSDLISHGSISDDNNEFEGDMESDGTESVDMKYGTDKDEMSEKSEDSKQDKEEEDRSLMDCGKVLDKKTDILPVEQDLLNKAAEIEKVNEVVERKVNKTTDSKTEIKEKEEKLDKIEDQTVKSPPKLDSIKKSQESFPAKDIEMPNIQAIDDGMANSPLGTKEKKEEGKEKISDSKESSEDLQLGKIAKSGEESSDPVDGGLELKEGKVENVCDVTAEKEIREKAKPVESKDKSENEVEKKQRGRKKDQTKVPAVEKKEPGKEKKRGRPSLASIAEKKAASQTMGKPQEESEPTPKKMKEKAVEETMELQSVPVIKQEEMTFQPISKNDEEIPKEENEFEKKKVKKKMKRKAEANSDTEVEKKEKKEPAKGPGKSSKADKAAKSKGKKVKEEEEEVNSVSFNEWEDNCQGEGDLVPSDCNKPQPVIPSESAIAGAEHSESEKPDESSASNSTVSSGIGSGASLKSTELDAMSVGSGTVGLGKVLSLSLKGEWMLLEQVLRTLDKGNPDVSQREEENGLSPLMVAVRENKLVIAERLLDLGANINDRANDGRTPLHFAATFAKDDVVKLLLNRKADQTIPGGPRDQIPLHMASARQSGALSIVQILLKGSSKDLRLTQDKNGCIPLFLAAEAGNTSVCKELLSQCSESQLLQQRKENGDSALHIACRRRDIDMARMLIEAGSPVDLRNEEGHTPLHIAAWEGDEVMVKYLYQMKANPNFTDKMDRVPVHIAAERGHSAIVDLLVDKCKASISARTKDGSTLMHIASQYGHPDTALTFLKKGVPLHMPNKSGAICLHTAAMRGHTNVVRALLSKGASVDAKTKDGYTALHLAVECGKPQVVQMLLGYGAQVEFKGGKAGETPLHIAARTRDGERCAEMLMKSGADVNAVRENGETAMHIAARNGQLKMLQALMEEGGDPTQQSKNGETPLHVAVRHCHLAVAKELLTYVSMTSSRIDAVMLVNQQNWEGETPVHYAAELVKSMTHFEFEDTDIMRLLLQYDGDKNIQTKLTHETSLHYCARAGNEDILLEIVKHIGNTCVQNAVNKQSKNGWSPLLVASEQGHLQIVKILLQYHARVDVFDEYHGKAALHLAAENGHEQVADVLLWHKAFVNAKSKLGLTPLHLAAQNGYNDLVRLLIETHNAVIDALSLAKQTPLHMAAQCGKMEVCNTLMKMRADANATDVHGQTPLHLAAENDHSDVVKLFLKHRPELVSMANTNGMTCAHIAADKGSVAVIRELMKFNRSVVTTARNRTNNSTALHLAAAGGHKEVVEVLLKAGASATDENADGMTAIHLCARYGHVNILDALDGHVNWRITSKKTGLSAIHCAAHYGQVDFVREMLTKVPATVKSEHPGGGDSWLKDLGAESGLTPLHLAAQSGHEGLVRLLLNSPGVQADVSTNSQGAIPLHLAAQGGHSSVVSLLLSKSTTQLHVKDKRGRTALHLAAANGHIFMVSLLLGQGADINACDKNGWTALHFAAKAGYLNVVKLLTESGASPKFETKEGKVSICFAAAANHSDVLSFLMKRDHNTNHLMDDKKFVFDLMVCGKNSRNKCIEEFILLSPAPVDTAAKLSNNFRILAVREKERSRDLTSAGDYCENMATELLAIAASANSAGHILKAVDCNGTPFLDVLIENEQKEVVSHPAVQKYLTDVWMGNLKWATWKIVMVFMTFLFIPIIWLVFSLPLRHRFNRVPIIKFMAYLVSHLYLMLLFLLTVVYPRAPIWQSASMIPSVYEWLLLSWLSGLLVSELTNPGDRGGLGWVKVISIGISAIGVFCHVLAFAFDTNDRLLLIFIRNYFFAWALLMCFVQLLDFLSFHHLFGPWAIIIRDLLKDLTRFLVILLIFIAGFTLHLLAIYQPVYAPKTVNPSQGLGDGNGEAHVSQITLVESFGLLFFSLFGLVDPDGLPTTNQSPIWVVDMAKVTFGIYMMVTLVVLINLLIAMMSDTYQRIQQQSDTEWKFGRAKLIRNMNKTSATPSPLNLFTKLFTYCRAIYKHKGKLCSVHADEYISDDDDIDAFSDSRSVDLLAHNAGWLKNVVRRNTQVAPDGGFLRVSHHGNGPLRLEDVVDWPMVVKKYQSMQGMENIGTNLSDEDENDAVNKGVSGFEKDSATIT